jgi:hypothetical protein
MALRVKFPIVDRRVAFTSNGVFSPDTIAREFSRMVREDIARIDRENAAVAGHKLPLSTFVDGAEKEPLPAAVDQKSTISARWEVSIGAISYVCELLQGSGPVLSGAYRRSYRIYADGREVASWSDIPIGTREVLIVSTVPYARKIERGRGGYAPGAVYQAVAAMAAARYGNAARIKFTFAEPEGPAPLLDAWAKGHAARVGSPRKQAAQLSKDRRNPAIIFYLT